MHFSNFSKFIFVFYFLFCCCVAQVNFIQGAFGAYGEALNIFRLFIPSNNNIQENEGVQENVSACESIVWKFGTFNEMKVSIRAKGLCDTCCKPKQSRDLHFFVFNKLNREKGVEITPLLRKGAASRAGVVKELPTVIFIHGFSEASPGFSGKAIVDAYLSRPEDYNIILVDWSELSAFPWYVQAFRNVKLIANVLSHFIEFYHESGEIPIQNLHIVGFSLGAHIAGLTGKILKKGLRIPRITGLDPALPEFSLDDKNQRLCETDAEFVDVIHTDAGILGFPLPVGTTDFYPNGGRALQPGCQPSYLARQSLIDQMLACSHLRAWKLYAESVENPRAFPATKCKVWRGRNRRCDFKIDTFMGFSANRSNSQGPYYLLTRYKEPFSKSAEEQIT